LIPNATLICVTVTYATPTQLLERQEMEDYQGMYQTVISYFVGFTSWCLCC